MAIAASSNEVIRLVEALGLRTKNTREVTLRMAVNEAVAVNTVEYVNGEQIDALSAELKERQYRLNRWIPVEERLPEEGSGGVLGFRRSDIAAGEHSYGMAWNHGGALAWNEPMTPTHWMPLPEPPEAK